MRRTLKQWWHRGFTLVELVVVLTALGVTATMMIPAYNKYTDYARLREAMVQAHAAVAAANTLAKRKYTAHGFGDRAAGLKQWYSGGNGWYNTEPPARTTEYTVESQEGTAPQSYGCALDAAKADVKALAKVPGSVLDFVYGKNASVVWLVYQHNGFVISYRDNSPAGVADTSGGVDIVPLPVPEKPTPFPTKGPQGPTIVDELPGPILGGVQATPKPTPNPTPSPTPMPTPQVNAHISVSYKDNTWNTFPNSESAFLKLGLEQYQAWDWEYGDGKPLQAPESIEALFQDVVAVSWIPDVQNPGWKQPLEYGTHYTVSGTYDPYTAGTYLLTVKMLGNQPNNPQVVTSTVVVKIFEYTPVTVDMVNGGKVQLHYGLPWEFYRIRAIDLGTNMRLTVGHVIVDGGNAYVAASSNNVTLEPHKTVEECVAANPGFGKLNQKKVYTKASNTDLLEGPYGGLRWTETVPAFSLCYAEGTVRVYHESSEKGSPFNAYSGNSVWPTLPEWSYTAYPTLNIKRVSDKNVDLPGAELQLKNSQNEVVWQGKTTGTVLSVEGLNPLTEYTLEELTAPAGHPAAEPIRGISLRDGSCTVRMTNGKV